MNYPAELGQIEPELLQKWTHLEVSQQRFIVDKLQQLAGLECINNDLSSVKQHCQQKIPEYLINIAALYNCKDVELCDPTIDYQFMPVHAFLANLLKLLFSGRTVLTDLLLLPLGRQVMFIKNYGVERWLDNLGYPQELVSSNSQVRFDKIEPLAEQLFKKHYTATSPTVKNLTWLLYSYWLYLEQTYLEKLPELAKQCEDETKLYYVCSVLISGFGCMLQIPLSGLGGILAHLVNIVSGAANKRHQQCVPINNLARRGYEERSIYLIMTYNFNMRADDEKGFMPSFNIIKTKLQKYYVCSENQSKECQKFREIIYTDNQVNRNEEPDISSAPMFYESMPPSVLSGEKTTPTSLLEKELETVQKILTTVTVKPKIHWTDEGDIIEKYNRQLTNLKANIYWNVWLSAQISNLKQFRHVGELKGICAVYRKITTKIIEGSSSEQPQKINKATINALKDISSQHYYLVKSKLSSLPEEQKNIAANFFPSLIDLSKPTVLRLIKLAGMLYQKHVWHAFLVGSEIYWPSLAADHDIVIIVDDLTVAVQNFHRVITRKFQNTWNFSHQKKSENNDWISLAYNSTEPQVRALDIVFFSAQRYPNIVEVAKSRIFNVTSVAASLVKFNTVILPEAVETIERKEVEILSDVNSLSSLSAQTFFIKTLYKTFLRTQSGWKLGTMLQTCFENYLDVNYNAMTLHPALIALNKNPMLERLVKIWSWFVKDVLQDLGETLEMTFTVFGEEDLMRVKDYFKSKTFPNFHLGYVMFSVFLLLNDKTFGNGLERFLDHKKLGFTKQQQGWIIALHKDVVGDFKEKNNKEKYFAQNNFYTIGDRNLACQLAIDLHNHKISSSP